jgi:signal transduction histidine kinase
MDPVTEHDSQENSHEACEQLLRDQRAALLDTLTSSVAHDLKNLSNPLTLNLPVLVRILRAAVPFMDERFHEEGDYRVANMPWSKLRERLDRIIDGSEDGLSDLGEYTGRLRQLGRQESAEGQDRTVDVRDLAGSAVRLTRELIDDSTGRFSLQTPDSPATVDGHPDRLVQVIINLIENACHALTDRDQAITVNVRADAGAETVEIVVEDEGRGMEAEALESVYDIFFSGYQPTDTLGLRTSLCQRIVDAHGGELEFDSEPGRGTTARVTLPAHHSNEEV